MFHRHNQRHQLGHRGGVNARLAVARRQHGVAVRINQNRVGTVDVVERLRICGIGGVRGLRLGNRLNLGRVRIGKREQRTAVFDFILLRLVSRPDTVILLFQSAECKQHRCQGKQQHHNQNRNHAGKGAIPLPFADGGALRGLHGRLRRRGTPGCYIFRHSQTSLSVRQATVAQIST